MQNAVGLLYERDSSCTSDYGVAMPDIKKNRFSGFLLELPC